jgi:hypothetical protein
MWVAAAVLDLAAGLGFVVSRIHVTAAGRLLLLLPVVFLGHWFIRQVKAILAARYTEPRDERERCHRE